MSDKPHHLRANGVRRPEAAQRAGHAGTDGARQAPSTRRQHHAYPSRQQSPQGICRRDVSVSQRSSRRARGLPASSSPYPPSSVPTIRSLDCVRETGRRSPPATPLAELSQVKSDNTWAWPPMMFDKRSKKCRLSRRHEVRHYPDSNVLTSASCLFGMYRRPHVFRAARI